MDETREVVFDGSRDAGNMFSSEEIYGGKRDGEVDCTNDDIDTQGIPAISLDEVF